MSGVKTPKPRVDKYSKRNIFIHGLSSNANEIHIRQAFSKFGDILEVRFPQELPCKNTKRFAFIEFTDIKSVEYLLELQPEIIIDGVPVGFNHSLRKEDIQRKRKLESDCKIFVGNLPLSLKEDELREYFVRFGPIRSVKIMINPETKCSRGFGFILFFTKLAAEEAVNTINFLPGYNKRIVCRFYECERFEVGNQDNCNTNMEINQRRLLNELRNNMWGLEAQTSDHFEFFEPNTTNQTEDVENRMKLKNCSRQYKKKSSLLGDLLNYNRFPYTYFQEQYSAYELCQLIQESSIGFLFQSINGINFEKIKENFARNELPSKSYNHVFFNIGYLIKRFKLNVNYPELH